MKIANGSQITFNYIENDTDLLSYKGVEFQAIFIDESVDLTEYQIVYLKSRLRTTLKNFRPRLYLLTNPIGVSHAYHKERYIDGREPNKLYPAPETMHLDPKDRSYVCFIPAKLQDNPMLMMNDPRYITRMRELPEDEFFALLLGLWDVKSGLFFTEWDNNRCIEKENYIPKCSDDIHIYMDWGSAKPSAIGFVAVSEDGTEHLFDEIYTMKANNHDEGQNLQATAVAELISQKIIEIGHPCTKMVLDSQCWAKGGTSVESIFEILWKSLARHSVSIYQAKKDRVNGWQVVRKHLLINPATGKPYLQVSPKCKQFLRTFPVLMHDRTKDGDVDSRMEDHHGDGFRYFCMSRPVPSGTEPSITIPYGTMDYYLDLNDRLKQQY